MINARLVLWDARFFLLFMLAIFAEGIGNVSGFRQIFGPQYQHVLFPVAFVVPLISAGVSWNLVSSCIKWQFFEAAIWVSIVLILSYTMWWCTALLYMQLDIQQTKGVANFVANLGPNFSSAVDIAGAEAFFVFYMLQVQKEFQGD